MIRYLAAAAITTLAMPALAAPVDLSGWTAEGTSQNWVLQSGNDSVLQTVNGNPTVFYGPGNAQGMSLSGTIEVTTRSDDDFIGFVLGFNPGDLTNAVTDFILIDWKQNNQNSFGGTAQQGLAISHVSAGLGNNAGGWWHSPALGVTELARGTNLGNVGWADQTQYTFDLLFSGSNIQVFVDGIKELDVNGTFSDGAFGFYNYSQSNVLYAGITEDQLPPVGGIPEPASWAMLIAGFGLIGTVARRRRAVAA